MRKRDPEHAYERLSAVTKRVRAVASQAFAELDLGTAQAKILRHVGGHSRISQADLARATDTAPTLIGRALEPLVARGLVKRTRSDEDKREYVLELTAAGQRARAKVDAARDAILARMNAALDARDVEDLGRIADRLLAALGDDASPPPKKRA